ncbi:MAG: hypothetical protein RDU59_02825 [Thermodesulfobacteriota bacterium]|nr:hypothetical protein [Thermodesulfobacteriota bacterium]
MLRLLAHIGIILLLSLASFNCSPSDERANPIAGPSAKADENNPPSSPFSKGGNMLGSPLGKGDTGGFSNEISKRDGKQSKADSKLRIRLRRDAKGKYSWEITGDDVRQIIDADRRLRKKIGTGGGED